MTHMMLVAVGALVAFTAVAGLLLADVNRCFRRLDQAIDNLIPNPDEQAANAAWANRDEAVQAALRIKADRLTAMTADELLAASHGMDRVLEAVTR